METTRILGELRQERERIDAAILSFERLGQEVARNASKFLAELQQDRERVDNAILSFERLLPGRGRRRGRPPAWISTVAVKRRGRPPGSKNKTPAIEN